MAESNVFEFFKNYQSQNIKKKEIIIYPSDDNPGAFFLEEGFVRQYAISKEGVELTIHIFKPGSYFPSMQFFSNLQNRYYFETITECKIWKAPKEEMSNFIKNNPETLADFTDRMLNAIDKISNRVEQLVFGNAYKRTVSALIFLSNHFADRDGSGYRKFTHKFTHNDVAHLAGITRETATREIDKLKKAGLVEYKEHMLIIPSMELLKKEMNIELSKY